MKDLIITIVKQFKQFLFSPLQWNSHGYDAAKIFSAKFAYVSPVWLQIKRRYVEYVA